MIDVNQLRNGTNFTLDGEIYKVLNYHHNKTGRGGATIRVQVRNLRTGSTREMTFPSGDRVQDIRLDHHQVTYLYRDGNLYYFMDTETYEQPALTAETLGDNVNYLKEGQAAKLTFYEDEAIEIELPTAVDLEIVESEAGVRGGIVSGRDHVASAGNGGAIGRHGDLLEGPVQAALNSASCAQRARPCPSARIRCSICCRAAAVSTDPPRCRVRPAGTEHPAPLPRRSMPDSICR